MLTYHHCRPMRPDVFLLCSLVLQPAAATQAPHRRSTSFGGNGFALPGDAADLLRSDLVTSKVSPPAPAPVMFQPRSCWAPASVRLV